uniref:Uncharacterized protein n=1 Tax=viral metagenome TaxID=1070528 RepID=A0A6C0LH85_9ZZZZ
MATDIEYLEEELEDIEYTEILSFEEMSEINPSFIAMDKEEIYNNLYTFFKNKKKSDLLRSLFYDILVNRDAKNGKINDYANYVFATEGELTKYGEDDTPDAVLNFIYKYDTKVTRGKTSELSEFVKRKFCVSYDHKSEKIRLKPTRDTTILIEDDKKNADFPKYHQIIKDYPVINCRNVDKVEHIYNINDGDDISLPITGAYYKIPTSTTNDYMYAKIASHLLNSVNANYKTSANYKGIYELIKDTRPDIEMIMSEINSNKDSFYLDYGNINNIFKKYDYSLDFITEKDLALLTDLMDSIIKKEKERKNIHHVFKIKRPLLVNKKLTFFDNIDKTLKVIQISPQVHSFLEKTKDIILKYKNDIIQTEVIPLGDYNIYSIIKQINNNTVSIEEVVEDLKLSIKTINIDHTLNTINDILEAQENIESIKEDCEKVKNTFIHSREHIYDYDKDGKKYVISKRENKAICDANDIDNYEGVKDDDDIIDDENKGFVNDEGGAGGGTGGIANNYELNRYIANIHFKNEKGFIEMLRIILELLKKVNNVANIDIDYDDISAYLFKKYRSVSTRYEKYLKEFEKNNIEGAEKYAKKYSQMTALHILDIMYNKGDKKEFTERIDKNHESIIKRVNNEFIETTNIIFCNAICFWIVDTQDKIFKGQVALNMNDLNPNHLDKLNTRGLLYYIIDVISDFFKYTDNNDYIINIKDLRKNFLSIVENEYKDRDPDILSELLSKKAEGKNKCAIDRNKYTDDEMFYIDKLLYTPNSNSKFEKIHKYIQGCCLRKLDNNFNDITDFNDDVIKLKEYHSKVRLINNVRDTRFTPPKERSKNGKKNKKRKEEIEREDDIVDSDDDDIFMKEVKEKNKHVKYINKSPFVYNFKNYSADAWLESMRGKSELLPGVLIDKLINYDMDSIKSHITENIKKLKNVKNNISLDFLNCDYINYTEVLLNISRIIYMNANSSKYNDNEVLKENIMNSVKQIKMMIKHLYNLNKNYNAEEADVVNIINIVVISNSLHTPDLSGIENIPKEFIRENAEKLYEYLKSYVGGKYNKFLTAEEIAVFINEKREEYKIKKLKENQDLDIEENEIRRQMKVAGITVVKDVDIDGEANAKADDVDAEGDMNDAYKGEEKDKDYNSKDNDNYNIYDDVDEDMD